MVLGQHCWSASSIELSPRAEERPLRFLLSAFILPRHASGAQILGSTQPQQNSVNTSPCWCVSWTLTRCVCIRIRHVPAACHIAGETATRVAQASHGIVTVRPRGRCGCHVGHRHSSWVRWDGWAAWGVAVRGTRLSCGCGAHGSFSCTRHSSKPGYRCTRFEVTNHLAGPLSLVSSHLDHGDWEQSPPSSIASGAVGAWESNRCVVFECCAACAFQYSHRRARVGGFARLPHAWQ